MRGEVRLVRKYRKWLLGGFLFLLLFFLVTLFIVDRYLEPVLRSRLHTLIVQGSDSLYRYKLGGLTASIYGGSVEVEDLQVDVDSFYYRKLAAADALPSLTMQLNLKRGEIKGLGVLPLLLGKRITIKEIVSKDANIRLSRHLHPNDSASHRIPIWKSIQPTIRRINIDKINLDGVKLLYRNADTSESEKIQFDTCYAVFEDIRIDSVGEYDTARIGFAKDITMRFRDLKFRSFDSSYKLKAETIRYSSKERTFEVQDFKLQPTREDRQTFYQWAGMQKQMTVIELKRLLLTNFRLDHFIHSNIVAADTLYIEKPEAKIFLDRGYPPGESKVGHFPHQSLLEASANIRIKGIVMQDANIRYTEKTKTGNEGRLTISNVSGVVSNVTNDALLIHDNPKCVAKLQGTILEKSPVSMQLTFYLDSTNGRFDASGTVSNVSAAQMNELADPLANTYLQSFDMQRLDFALSSDDFTARGQVRLKYNNLYVVLRKRDKETGAIETNQFFTRLLNEHALYPSNPGPDGVERVANDVRQNRLTTSGFFGFLWKAIFSGMQDVMMKGGK